VQRFVVSQVRRAVEEGRLAGDPTDVAHALLALSPGLAAQETGGWLGTSKANVDRRWRIAVAALLDGLAPDPAR
jgi:hypothetical protein